MSHLRELMLRPFSFRVNRFNLVSERVLLASSRAVGPGDKAWRVMVATTMNAMR